MVCDIEYLCSVFNLNTAELKNSIIIIIFYIYIEINVT